VEVGAAVDVDDLAGHERAVVGAQEQHRPNQVLGLLLALMLVAMLQHVFDPPPDALAVPWVYLGELAGAALVATTLAVAIAARRLRHPSARAAVVRSLVAVSQDGRAAANRRGTMP